MKNAYLLSAKNISVPYINNISNLQNYLFTVIHILNQVIHIVVY